MTADSPAIGPLAGGLGAACLALAWLYGWAAGFVRDHDPPAVRTRLAMRAAAAVLAVGGAALALSAAGVVPLPR